VLHLFTIHDLKQYDAASLLQLSSLICTGRGSWCHALSIEEARPSTLTQGAGAVTTRRLDSGRKLHGNQ